MCYGCNVFAKRPAICGTMLLMASAAVAAPAEMHARLETLAQRSVFFGHQSVGMNLLEGLRDLAGEQKVPLRIVEGPPAPGTFAHRFVPENGDPLRKLKSFASGLEPSPQIAMLKFCFVDFDARTDAAALFARYQAALADLQARHPQTVFVHVTVPLTTAQGGPKAWVKKLLGRAPAGVAENAKRDEYNALLRAAYQGRAPLFDLAAIESTRPDGSRESVEWNGREVPALVPAYASDGAHLNAEGRRRAAERLAGVLAAVPLRQD